MGQPHGRSRQILWSSKRNATRQRSPATNKNVGGVGGVIVVNEGPKYLDEPDCGEFAEGAG
jgi:hypothetical protein